MRVGGRIIRANAHNPKVFIMTRVDEYSIRLLSDNFIDEVNVSVDGQQVPVNSLMDYNTELSDRLHQLDRVHTYCSFYIAQLKN